jgi:hypothetical protein
MSHFGRKRIRVTMVIATVILLVLIGIGATWSSYVRQRPSLISGVWLMDDLRTEGDDASKVIFFPSGVYDDGVGEFAGRWRYNKGRMYLRTWKTDPNSKLARAIQDTTIYSWFIDTQEFSLGVELSEDCKTMTLTADGEGPRCRLRRSGR